MSGNLLFILIYVISCGINGKSHVPELRCEDADKKVFLVDNVLESKEVQWFTGFSQRHRPWILNDIHGAHFLDKNSNVTWVSPISQEVFQTTRLWGTLSGIVRSLSLKEYFICDAMFTMTYRMDYNPLSKDMEDGLMIRIFLNDDMRKNDYGEMVFYNSKDDVLCSVYPAGGRAIIWNGSIGYIPKPPSMLYVQSQNSIVLKLTDSHDKYEHCLDQYKVNEKSVFKPRYEDFPFTNGQLQSITHGKINYEKHLTNKYFDSHGHEIAVFDGIMTQSDLNILRAHLARDYNSFGFQPYDTDKTEDHDNVAWISAQKVDVLVQSGLWEVVKQGAQYLSGLDEWYPYDVSMNIIHSFHHTRIHEDCEADEYEYTFLLYLNPDWNANDYGETVFFDLEDTDKDIKPGDEEYEIVAAVRPRYGRIVIFRGIIPHSARPPSPGFKGARYTFACKVSKTFRIAQSKQLQETMEALHESGITNAENTKLWQELRSDQQANSKRPTTFLQAELFKQKQRLDNFFKNNQETLLKKLSK